MAFADHFSAQSDQYARARPTYPDALYEFIAAAALSDSCAWDCATGSGQAAAGLARHFARVEATDASAQQVANATAHANIRYSVQPAERTNFAAASFDAVCVAQALHWFDLEAFYGEVRRVLKPGGIIAVWGYDWMPSGQRFDAMFAAGILAKLKPYWPAQNRILWDGYRTIAFPFERIDAPAFEMRIAWTFEQFRAYVETWSGTQRCLGDRGPDYLDDEWAQLSTAWGERPQREFAVPLHFLCGRHGSR